MALFRRDPATSASTELSAADAVAGVAVAAMYADGVLGGEEYEALTTQLCHMALFDEMHEGDLRAMFERIEGLVAAEGEDALLARCAQAVPERLRATAFLVAAEIVFEDRAVSHEELQFLARIQKALGVDEPTAKKVTDVVRLRHVA